MEGEGREGEGGRGEGGRERKSSSVHVNLSVAYSHSMTFNRCSN